jgi:hypothetical protein
MEIFGNAGPGIVLNECGSATLVYSEVCLEFRIGTKPGLLEKSVDYIPYTLVFRYGLMNIRVQNQKRFLHIRKR